MLNTNYKFGQVYKLADQVLPETEKVQFQNIFSNNNGGVSLLAFVKDQELPEHFAPAEVMVLVLEGSIQFTMLEDPHTIHTGEYILMGPAVPHKVKALENAKVALIKLKP